MKERYIATNVGCGNGDTVGMSVEGMKMAQIQKYVPGGRVTGPMDPVLIKDDKGKLILGDEFGQLGYYTRDLKKGQWTDDTICTAAVGESIVAKKGLDLEDCAKRHLKEYESRLQPDGHVIGGFGMTTTDAFKNLLEGKSPYESGVIGGPGNGASMKMHPIGLHMHATGEYQEGLSFAQDVGNMTHLDPRAEAGGVVQAHSIYALLNDCSKKEFLDSIAEVSRIFEKPLTEEFRYQKGGDLTSKFEWVRDNQNVSDQEAFDKLGASAKVMESHPFTVFMFQKYWDEPIEGLLETINFGGDCDTTGAIYGALAGAKHGMIFPKEWNDQLQEINRLKKIGEGIYNLRTPHNNINWKDICERLEK